jgi:hypothetical protein
MGVENPVDEAVRVMEAAESAGLNLRVTGGVAIAMICPSARDGVLARPYADVDFIARRCDCGAVEEFFPQIGYVAEEEFNALHGENRLFFQDLDLDREADVFIDAVRACHHLDVRDRLDVWQRTLSPADLLLSKLQVVETNEKDYKDAIALLADHELTDDESGISVPRIAALCARDWGWWRTVTMVAARTADVADRYAQEAPSLHGVSGRLRTLLDELERAPKSRKWKLRAKVGDRVAWHDEPEELDHGH